MFRVIWKSLSLTVLPVASLLDAGTMLRLSPLQTFSKVVDFQCALDDFLI